MRLQLSQQSWLCSAVVKHPVVSVCCRTLLNFDTILLHGLSCLVSFLNFHGKRSLYFSGFQFLLLTSVALGVLFAFFFFHYKNCVFFLAFPVCMFWEQIPRNSAVRLHFLPAPRAPSHIFQGTGLVLKFAVLAKSKDLCPVGGSCAGVLAQAGTVARSGAWGNDLCSGTETSLCALCSPAW